MALQFDMSKNNWQQDLMLQKQMSTLGENLGDAGAVVGQKLFPEGGKNVGKNLLAAALAVPGAIGATGLAIKKGSKGLQQKIKGARQNISTGIKNTGRKVKQAADTAVDLFIGDKDMLDQFEGSQDSTLVKALKQRKLKRLQKQARKKSLTPSIEMSDRYVTERPQDIEFGEVDFGLPSKMYRKTIPMPGPEPLPEFEAPIPKPAREPYTISAEIEAKKKRDVNNMPFNPNVLYSGKEAQARGALMNQIYGPLQSLIIQQQESQPNIEQPVAPPAIEDEIDYDNITPDMIKKAPIEYYGPASNEMLYEIMQRNKIRTDGAMDMRVNNPY
tara:strand:- start:245 stop:1231 length:987 start_codon:yes stop_codon:yes gene_type:complete